MEAQNSSLSIYIYIYISSYYSSMTSPKNTRDIWSPGYVSSPPVISPTESLRSADFVRPIHLHSRSPPELDDSPRFLHSPCLGAGHARACGGHRCREVAEVEGGKGGGDSEGEGRDSSGSGRENVLIERSDSLIVNEVNWSVIIVKSLPTLGWISPGKPTVCKAPRSSGNRRSQTGSAWHPWPHGRSKAGKCMPNAFLCLTCPAAAASATQAPNRKHKLQIINISFTCAKPVILNHADATHTRSTAAAGIRPGPYGSGRSGRGE